MKGCIRKREWLLNEITVMVKKEYILIIRGLSSFNNY